MPSYKTLLKGLLAASAVSMLSVGTASAAGTAANTTVTNTFTLDYTVGGVGQPQIDTDNPTDRTEFTVDRVINVTIDSNGDNTVAPDSTGEELTFTLTNTGNDEQAYTFDLISETEAGAAADQFNPANLTVTYFVGTSATGTAFAYDPTDGFSSVNVPADGQLFVVVSGDIPAAAGTLDDGDIADISLVAETHEPHAAPASENTATTAIVVADADGVNTIDGAAENVFADGAGLGRPTGLAAGAPLYTNDAATDGSFSATARFTVASPDLVAEKTVYVLSEDGSGCGTVAALPNNVDNTGGARDGLHIVPTNGFHAIPGACVEYRISVTNRGATAASNVAGINIVDALPTDLTFIEAEQNGFTNVTFNHPVEGGAGIDCSAGGTTCTVSVVSTNATPGNTTSNLAAGANGVIVIHALVN